MWLQSANSEPPAIRYCGVCGLNPVTRHLLLQLNDPDLTAWIEAGDQLEDLVVRVYKRGRRFEATTFARLRRTLRRGYPAHKRLFEPHWAEAGVDPFEAVLDRRGAAAFVGDWAGMQTLPTAWQAINLGLLDLSHRSGRPPGDPGI